MLCLQSLGVTQAEEEVTVNGEKVENASEEEESEELESDEEERLPLAEGPAQRGSCETFAQVGLFLQCVHCALFTQLTI